MAATVLEVWCHKKFHKTWGDDPSWLVLFRSAVLCLNYKPSLFISAQLTPCCQLPFYFSLLLALGEARLKLLLCALAKVNKTLYLFKPKPTLCSNQQLTRTQHGFTWIGTICVSRVFSVKAYAMRVFHVIIVSEFKARKNQKLRNRFITFLICSANYFFNLTLIRWPLQNSKCELQSVGN